MKKLILIITAALTLLSCGPKNGEPNVELMQDMMENEAIKAQEMDADAPNHIGMRLPPENTVPVGYKPYRYDADIEGAMKNPNPISGDMSPDVLMTGQKMYETYCAVCHGMKAKGDGPVGAKMPLKPPPLVSDKVKGLSDGHVYHIITKGQGIMGAHGPQIPQSMRWQLVNYIRYLGKQDSGK